MICYDQADRPAELEAVTVPTPGDCDALESGNPIDHEASVISIGIETRTTIDEVRGVKLRKAPVD